MAWSQGVKLIFIHRKCLQLDTFNKPPVFPKCAHLLAVLPLNGVQTAHLEGKLVVLRCRAGFLHGILSGEL